MSSLSSISFIDLNGLVEDRSNHCRFILWIQTLECLWIMWGLFCSLDTSALCPFTLITKFKFQATNRFWAVYENNRGRKQRGLLLCLLLLLLLPHKPPPHFCMSQRACVSVGPMRGQHMTDVAQRHPGFHAITEIWLHREFHPVHRL